MLRWILGLTLKDRKRHPSHHWSSMHYGQGTWGQAELVWTYTTERRRWLCQTNPRGRRSWTKKSRKTEKEMDRRRQVQHGGLVAHGRGLRESCRMEKENPCGWPLTRGIHSLKERDSTGIMRYLMHVLHCNCQTTALYWLRVCKTDRNFI